MKYKILSMLAGLLLLTPVFTACNDDDDDIKGDDSVVNVSDICGDYEGTLAYSVMGFDPGNIEGNFDLKIVKDTNDDDEVIVVLPACSFTPPIPQTSTFTIPSITISGVDVTVKGDVYTLNEDDFTFEVNGTAYTGKLDGKVVGKQADIEYVVRPGRMPMDINFSFKGIVK